MTGTFSPPGTARGIFVRRPPMLHLGEQTRVRFFLVFRHTAFQPLLHGRNILVADIRGQPVAGSRWSRVNLLDAASQFVLVHSCTNEEGLRQLGDDRQIVVTNHADGSIWLTSSPS